MALVYTVTRSGRQVKIPERYEPVEIPLDDFRDDEYTDTDSEDKMSINSDDTDDTFNPAADSEDDEFIDDDEESEMSDDDTVCDSDDSEAEEEEVTNTTTDKKRKKIEKSKENTKENDACTQGKQCTKVKNRKQKKC